MKVIQTDIPGAVIIEPRRFTDERGFFMETYQQRRFAEAGLPIQFVQDNHSHSYRHVLRGLHYQIRHAQGKLVRVVRGEIFDVVVDLRRASPTFGKWLGMILSEFNDRQFYLPPGLAHGFCVLSEQADVAYSCTDFYSPADERTLLWNDAALGINWPIANPILSEKDRGGIPLAAAPCYEGGSLLATTGSQAELPPCG